VFRLLPIADWSARVLGHLFYVSFLLLMFTQVRRLSSERVATLTVLLLWSWYLFSNIFSTYYLEPGVLFFGAASVFTWESARRRASRGLAAGAGVLLALAVLYKGLTVLGFLPAWAWVARRPEENSSRAWRAGGLAALSAFAAVLLAYALLLRYGGAPDFLSHYWSRQVTHRFGQKWSLWRLLDREYWEQLLRYTYYLAPVGLLALVTRPDRRSVLPAILAVSFITLFASNGLRGGQYLVMVLPWIAWLVAEAVDSFLALPPRGTARVTAVFSIAALFVLQYVPVRTHSQAPGVLEGEIRRTVDAGRADHLYVDTAVNPEPFFQTARLAWYGDVTVEYADPASPPAADARGLYFSRAPTEETRAVLRAKSWCEQFVFSDGVLWSACPPAGHNVR
jgi:4-amino-4-deoxy-L-arabinose transferase-like glycosyltransferase